MILDSTVTVIKDDGTRVLTNEVNEGDHILGTTYDELVEMHQVPVDDTGWTRFHNEEPRNNTAAAPVVDSVLHPDRPSDDASKRAWWHYAIDLGYGGEDYEHTSKAQLIAMYGNVDPKGHIGA